MLKIEQLNQYYGQSQALWNLDLEVPEGECTVLMGRNGVGKTTLLKCIMGLLPVKSGSMQFAGADLLRVAAEQRAGMGLGYVPQGRQIFPMLTVEENLQIGLPVRHDRVRKVPDFIYELFPVLKEMQNRHGGDLSGGQQQQLAIGRALVIDPKLLILDEPTANIDLRIETDIFDLLRLLNQRMTIIVVSHDIGFISRYVDRVACLNRTLMCHRTEEIDGQTIQALYDVDVRQVAHSH